MRVAAIAICLVLGACAPKNETVITPTTAFGEWTRPARVVIVPPPYCEIEFRAYVAFRMNPRVTWAKTAMAADRVIRCYRDGNLGA